MNYECKLKELLGFELEHRPGLRRGQMDLGLGIGPGLGFGIEPVLGPGLGLGLIPALGLSIGLRDLHFKFGQVEAKKTEKLN